MSVLSRSGAPRSQGILLFCAQLVSRCSLLLLVATLPKLSAADWALQGALNAHDPSLLKEGDIWWCLSTGPGIRVKYSTDGLTWEARPALISKEKSWWKTYAPAQRPLDVWAPDLHAFAGRFWCYYC